MNTSSLLRLVALAFSLVLASLTSLAAGDPYAKQDDLGLAPVPYQKPQTRGTNPVSRLVHSITDPVYYPVVSSTTYYPASYQNRTTWQPFRRGAVIPKVQLESPLRARTAYSVHYVPAQYADTDWQDVNNPELHRGTAAQYPASQVQGGRPLPTKPTVRQRFISTPNEVKPTNRSLFSLFANRDKK